MATISGPARQNGRFPASDTTQSPPASLSRCHMVGLLILCGLELGCGTPHLSAVPSVDLSSDRQVLLVSNDQTPPARVTLQNLPTESTVAPGLFFHPQGFDQVCLSPDGRHVAFSTVDHHTLVGLLDLSLMAVREIDVITEGDISAFHWSVDSRTLVYDYIPSSGYRRVKAHDVQSQERLLMPRIEGSSSHHLTFERWGPQPREVVLSITNVRTNERRMTTITLIPQK